MKRGATILSVLLLASCADPYHGTDMVEFNNRPLITYDEHEIFGTPPVYTATTDPDGQVVIKHEQPEEGSD